MEGKKRVMKMLRSVLLTNTKSPSPGFLLCFDLSEGHNSIVLTFFSYVSFGVENRDPDSARKIRIRQNFPFAT